MRTIAALLLVGCLTVTLTSCTGYKHHRAGDAAAATGDMRSAVYHYERALANRETYARDDAFLSKLSAARARVAYAEAQKLRAQGRYEPAIEQLREAMRQDPGFAEPAALLPTVLKEAAQWRHTQALASADHGDLAAARDHLSRSMQHDMTDDAVADAMASLTPDRLEPTTPGLVAYQDGIALSAERRWLEAEQHLEASVAANGSFLPARAALHEAQTQLAESRRLEHDGRQLIEQLTMGPAIKSLKQSLSIWPGNTQASEMLDDAQAQRAQADKRFDEATQAAGQTQWDEAMTLADSGLAIDRSHAGLEELRDALPQRAAESYTRRGDRHLQKDELDKAHESYSRALSFRDQHHKARLGLAYVYDAWAKEHEQAGRLGAALLHYEKGRTYLDLEVLREASASVMEQLRHRAGFGMSIAVDRPAGAGFVTEGMLSDTMQQAFVSKEGNGFTVGGEDARYELQLVIAGDSINQRLTGVEQRNHRYTTSKLRDNPEYDRVLRELRAEKQRLDQIEREYARAKHDRENAQRQYQAAKDRQAKRERERERLEKRQRELDDQRAAAERRKEQERQAQEKRQADKQKAAEREARQADEARGVKERRTQQLKEAETRKEAPDRRKAEEASQRTEKQRKADAAREKAEEERKRAEAQRKAEAEARRAEERKKAEERKAQRLQQAEERKKEAERRKAEEARKRAEAQRKAEEAREKAAEERKRAEQQRKAEREAKKAEERHKAEERQKAKEEKRKAEEARKKAEAERRKAEAERKKAEQQRRKEEERKRQEERKKTKQTNAGNEDLHVVFVSTSGHSQRHMHGYLNRDADYDRAHRHLQACEARCSSINARLQKQQRTVQKLKDELAHKPKQVWVKQHHDWAYTIETHTVAAKLTTTTNLIDRLTGKPIKAVKHNADYIYRDSTIIGSNPEIGLGHDRLLLPSDDVVAHDLSVELSQSAAPWALELAVQHRMGEIDKALKALQKAKKTQDIIEAEVDRAIVLGIVDPEASEQALSKLMQEHTR